jgi:hypothetical protein
LTAIFSGCTFTHKLLLANLIKATVTNAMLTSRLRTRLAPVADGIIVRAAELLLSGAQLAAGAVTALAWPGSRCCRGRAPSSLVSTATPAASSSRSFGACFAFELRHSESF